MQSVTPAASQTQTNQTNSANSATKDSGVAEAVDFQNFLTLLTAQLKHQDPLDPADSTEFVAQLAQFSSVEQLVSANDKLDSIASSIVSDGFDKYASWIGREAETSSSSAYFDGANSVRFRLSGSEDAATMTTSIFDQAGNEIAQINAANTSAVQSWNGQIDGEHVPPGIYTISATYFDAEGERIGSEVASTFSIVREVRLNGDQPTIVLTSGVEVKPSDVKGLGISS
ncbi:flagellar hook capping FlgD N-terminal domain-containing protein [Hyphococcus formosus]|uniref:flagellar hook assembly protein FlgD n=1 Tax=Hyphococcus formosus TaxID=3143534 RepID=UPI00398A94CC